MYLLDPTACYTATLTLTDLLTLFHISSNPNTMTTGGIAYRGIGLRDYLMNDPALRMQREVSRTRVYW